MNFRTFTLVAFFLYSMYPLFGQNTEQNLLSRDLADQLYEKSKQLISTSLDSSHYYANRVSEIALEIHDKEYLAKSYFLQGYLYFMEKKPALGVKYQLRARLIYQQLGDLDQEQLLLDNVVNIAIENHIFSVGEYYGDKRLKMVKNIEDFRIRSDIYADLGYIYMNNDMLTRSKEYFSKAKLEMENNQSLADTAFYAKILTVLGVVNRRIANKTIDLVKKDQILEDAKELYNHSLKVNASVINRIKIYNNIGYLLMHHEDKSKALAYFQKAISIPNVASERVKLPAINNIGHYYFESGNYDSAFTYFSQAIDLNIQEKDYHADQYDRSISINLYSVDELKKSLKYLEEINQKAPHLALKNQASVYGYLNLQIERIENLKLIEVNEMLEEVNADIQKEKDLASSVVTFVDWLTYIGSTLLLIALTVVSVKLRQMYIANQKRIKHNKRIIDEIKNGHSKE